MNSTLRKLALELISDQFLGADCSGLSDDKVRAWIDEMYLGGWAKFYTDNMPKPPPVPVAPTPFQLLLEVYNHTGIKLHMQMFETIEKISYSDKTVTVLINACEVTERRNEYQIKRTGKRMVQLYDQGYRWIIEDTFELWNDDSAQTVKRGEVDTVMESAQKAEWERICYRPGNARNPMDNYDSVDTDRMAKHWRK